jgi:hypothetical protein
MRKILLVAAAFLLPFLAAVPAAQAQTPNICGNDGSGYCINAWNGGPDVKMYYGNYSNDNFSIRYVYACSGSDTVQSTAHGDTTNCPFSNTNLDSDFYSDPIVEVADGNNGECVGTSGSAYSTSAYGYLGSCGNSEGTGAIDGAFNVLWYDSGCGYAFVNRYWSNQNSVASYWVSGGNPDTYLYVGQQESWTCWGGAGI